MFPYVAFMNAAGWAHLALFGAYIPALVVLNRKKAIGAGQPLPDRRRYFQQTALMLAIFAGVSLMVARVQWIDLFPASFPDLASLGAGVALYAGAVAYMLPRWRRAVQKRVRVVHFFMPSNAAERGWWIAVAVLAGVSEEITWRGVQTALLIALTGDYWVAAGIASLSFGAAHMMQGWKSSALIGVFALGFHALVWLSGSLYVAMAVHVAYDVTAGIAYGRLGRRLGYDSSPTAELPR